MMKTNRFGTGEIYDIYNALNRSPNSRVYFECTGCMSVYSDVLSWVSGVRYGKYSVGNPANANVIAVIGCQVTDLAILNDIRTAEFFHEHFPLADIYMGGCLAQRFDIKLPDWLRRLDVVRDKNVAIHNDALVTVGWAKPFWVRNFDTRGDELDAGHLFRGMYPLKIGAGCHGKCAYCTIRDTRGEGYESDAFLQVKEFLDNEDVVLVSDSPTVKQIEDWALISKRYNKPISIRNVEPRTAYMCEEVLCTLAHQGLLKIFHCPIQSRDENVLYAMNRSYIETWNAIDLMRELRHRGAKVATNIIRDYVVDGKIVENMDVDWLNEYFDYWVWNPYFDGNWDRAKAEERFKKYIG